MAANPNQIIDVNLANLPISNEADVRVNANSNEREFFFASAIHDLKNPLHSVVLFIAALKQAQDPKRIQYLIDQLDKSTQGLDGLFKRLLDITRIDKGQLELTPVHFALSTVIESLQCQFAQIAKNRNVELRCSVADDLMVFADPVVTAEVLMNLLSNAIRYTKVGHVTVYARTVGTKVLIGIQDTGIGIPKSRLSAVFDEFVQIGPSAHSDSNQIREGVGLGLAIVKRLVDAMGASIRVQSEVGQGSVFSFQLPAGVYNHDAVPELTTYDSLRGVLVLVVDDDIHALTAIEALLISQQCFVILARTLPEAIEKLEANERFPDLVITESQLTSDVNALQIISECNRAIGSALPAVVLSKSALDCPLKAYGATTTHLKKPASPTEILDAIIQVLPSNQP